MPLCIIIVYFQTLKGVTLNFIKFTFLGLEKATTAAAQGMSDEVISGLGRWNSYAVKNNIRTPIFFLYKVVIHVFKSAADLSSCLSLIHRNV